MENKQKEFNKKLRKNLKTYNSYTNPKFLSKKISVNSLFQAKKVQKVNDTFVSKSDKYTISIPLTSTDNIILKESTAKAFKKSSKSKKDTYNFMISLPNKENNTFAGQAKVAKDNTVIYKDYQENTDVAVQAFKDSVRILTILNDADAPSDYTYDINLPIGGHMKKLDDGSVVILDQNKKFEGAITSAWALDKEGKKVPTHYEIRGNKLIQIVEHLSLNVTYPVVADPYYGKVMIDEVFWRDRPQSQGNSWYHYSITVKPSTFGLSSKRFYYARVGWSELRRKIDNNHWLNDNTESMIRQYFCHINFAWVRDEYHLEHWRPLAPWLKTMSWGCNPPGYFMGT